MSDGYQDRGKYDVQGDEERLMITHGDLSRNDTFAGLALTGSAERARNKML